MEAAIQLVARGVGDTVVARAVLGRMRGTRSLHAAPFDDPMWETFALIARRDAPVSPATRRSSSSSSGGSSASAS